MGIFHGDVQPNNLILGFVWKYGIAMYSPVISISIGNMMINQWTEWGSISLDRPNSDESWFYLFGGYTFFFLTGNGNTQLTLRLTANEKKNQKLGVKQLNPSPDGPDMGSNGPDMV